MTHSQLSAFLGATIPAKLPVLIKGAPGIGKTDAVLAASRLANADLIISHPVVSDPTDAKGLPWKVEGRDAATFLPFGDLERAIKADRLTVWFLDDLGQATPAVQASFMHLILARQIAGHQLPDDIVFVAATNRREDRAGVQGILEPVKSRFAAIVELEADLDSWLTWANANQISPLICAFLMFRPELLHQFAPTADITNSPSPRTWAKASQLTNLGLPLEIELAALEGAIGKAAAIEVEAFMDIWAQLPNVAEVFMAPDTAPVPDGPAALYGISSALAAQVNDRTFGALTRYSTRLPQEFAAVTLKSTVQRQPALTRTPAFVQWATSPQGREMFGASGV